MWYYWVLWQQDKIIPSYYTIDEGGKIYSWHSRHQISIATYFELDIHALFFEVNSKRKEYLRWDCVNGFTEIIKMDI